MKLTKVTKYLPPIGQRPKCKTKGCNNECQPMGSYSKKTGMAFFRKTCTPCHSKKIAKKHGLNSLAEVVANKRGMTVAKYQLYVLKKSAKKAGFDNHVDFRNSKHKYLKYRLTYCENIDGRLGFVCTTSIVDSAMLEVDHINNVHNDNSKGNHQTLCNCCHSYKTRYFGKLSKGTYIKQLLTDNIVNHFESFK